MPVKQKIDRQSLTFVWLCYRSKGSDTIHKLLFPSYIANRYLHRLARSKRCDYIRIEGTLEPAIIHKIAKSEQVQREVDSFLTKKKQAYLDKEMSYRSELQHKRGKYDLFQRMSFHVEELKQDVLVFCPVTGIFGRLEMPALPIVLEHTHPLAIPANALSVINIYENHKSTRNLVPEHKLDIQVLAGCILSLLRGKNLLRVDEETTAAERNMVLQNAGVAALRDLAKQLAYFWDNPQVWKRMPAISIEWKQHARLAHGIALQYRGMSVLQTVQEYTKILRNIMNPAELTQEEQAKIFAAQRRKHKLRQRITSFRIHSAAAVQQRKIKEAKVEIRELFDLLKPHMNIVLRTKLARVIRDLVILPESVKRTAATAVRVAFFNKFHEDQAKQLANLLEAASSDKMLEEIDRLSDDLPRPTKSIADILASKKKDQYNG